MTIADRFTLSVVSHGHGPLVEALLRDLDAIPALANARVLLTLNLTAEQVDTTTCTRLRIEILRNDRPLGFGANHNQAFSRCATPWFAVLNPDLRLDARALERLAAAAEANPAAGLLAPRVVNSLGEFEDSVRANLSPMALLRRVLRRVSGRPHALPSPSRFRWYGGMCLLLRSAAYVSVGGFDERYFLYCEDYDLCARLHLAGQPLVLVPDAVVVHDAQRDSHRSLRHLRLHLTSMLRVWTSSPVWRIAVRDMAGRAA